MYCVTTNAHCQSWGQLKSGTSYNVIDHELKVVEHSVTLAIGAEDRVRYFNTQV